MSDIDLSSVPAADLIAELQRRYAGRPMRGLTVCEACGHAQDKTLDPDGVPTERKCRRCKKDRCEIVTAEQLAESSGLQQYARIGL
jgi:hypothetical protein